MANYDAVAGVDQSTLNRMSDQLYEIIYPLVFKGDVIVDREVLYSALYDIRKPPVFELSSSDVAAERIIRYLEKTVTDSAMLTQMKTYLMDEAVIFGLDFSDINFSVDVAGNGVTLDLTGSLACSCLANVDANGNIVPFIQAAEIVLGDRDPPETLLNEYVLPFLVDRLNRFLEEGFALRIPDFDGVSLSSPLPRIEGSSLMTYASLSSRGTTSLPGIFLGNDRIGSFAFADGSLATLMANFAIRNVHDSGKVHADSGPFSFKAEYEIDLSDAVVKIEKDNQAELGVTVYGAGKIKAKVWPFSCTLKMSITAVPKAHACLLIEGGELIYEVKTVEGFDVKIDIHHVPSFLNEFISFMTSTLLTPISQLIDGLIKGLLIPVYYLGPQRLNVAGLSVVLNLFDQKIQTVDADDRRLAFADGEISISREP